MIWAVFIWTFCVKNRIGKGYGHYYIKEIFKLRKQLITWLLLVSMHRIPRWNIYPVRSQLDDNLDRDWSGSSTYAIILLVIIPLVTTHIDATTESCLYSPMTLVYMSTRVFVFAPWLKKSKNLELHTGLAAHRRSQEDVSPFPLLI